MAKVPIPIPEKGGQFGPTFEQQATEKFKNIDVLIYAVVVAIIITAISALISVGGIVIDQLHFNNQTYKSQSDYWNWKVQSEQQNKINQLELEINLLKNNQPKQ